MNPATLIRRWAPFVVLVAIAAGAWLAADYYDSDEASVTVIDYEHELATPILSARRIPATLRAPVIDDALRPAVSELAVGSAEFQSCLEVEVDSRTIGAENTRTPLIPASNQKLLTTYTALEVFGLDYRFTTMVAFDGSITDGVLDGDLYLIGGGDPFLSTDDWWTQYESQEGRAHTRLEDLADAVVATGLTGINGSIIGDESLLDAVRAGPWAQRLIDQGQSGPLSALSVNEGHTAWPAEFETFRQRTQTTDPPLHGAQVLARLLTERGVVVGPVATGTAPALVEELESVVSPPLIDIVTHVNSYSNNFGAEILLKHIGRQQSGVGSTEAGAAVVEVVLSAPERRIDTSGLVVQDGSGLAEEFQRLTCALVVDLLAEAGADSEFARSLSIGGERGSLLGRHVDTPADGQVYAKTGTLNGVTALSGYVESPEEPGTFVIFSYIANGELAGLDQDLLAYQEPFVEDLAEYPEGPTIDDLDPAPPAEAP